jgi:cytochrome c biogenesis protein CcdA
MLRLALSLLVQAMAVREAKDAAVRGALYFVAGLLAATLLLGAVGCAMAGLWIYVAHHLGAVAAPLITAAALVILAGLALLLCRLPRARRRARAANVDPAVGLSNLIDSVLPGLFRDHKTTILVGAALLGLLSGRSRK